MNATVKPGLSTTEFWLLIAGFGLVILTGLNVRASEVYFALDVELAKWWLGALAAYILNRAYVKKVAVPPQA